MDGDSPDQTHSGALEGEEKQLEDRVVEVITAFSNENGVALKKSTCGQLYQLTVNGTFDPLVGEGDASTLWSGKVLKVEDLQYTSVYEDMGTVFGSLVYEDRLDPEMPWPIARFSLTKSNGEWQVCTAESTI